LATPFFQTGDTVPGAFWHTNTMICKTLQQDYDWSRERLGEAGFEPGFARDLKLEPCSLCRQTMASCAIADGKTRVFDFRVAGEFKVENNFVNLKFDFAGKIWRAAIFIL